jgi:hypothetical protein
MSGVIAGLAITAVSTGASFIQAGKQRKAERKASKAAAAALEEARKRLSVNYMDALSLPMEPREYLNNQMLQQGANIIGAAQEGERGVGEQAGKIYAQQQDAAEALRAQTSMDLFNIQEKQLNEDSRLRDAQASLDLAEAEGAQAAAAQAADAANMATAQGIQGMTDIGMLAFESADLYKDADAAAARKEARKARRDETSLPPTDPQQGVALPPNSIPLTSAANQRTSFSVQQHPWMRNWLQPPYNNTLIGTPLLSAPYQPNAFSIWRYPWMNNTIQPPLSIDREP